MSTRARPLMQTQPRARSRTDRLALLDEEDDAPSPSYFEWRERTVRTTAIPPAPKPTRKTSAIARLFRRFI